MMFQIMEIAITTGTIMMVIFVVPVSSMAVVVTGFDPDVIGVNAD